MPSSAGRLPAAMNARHLSPMPRQNTLSGFTHQFGLSGKFPILKRTRADITAFPYRRWFSGRCHRSIVRAIFFGTQTVRSKKRKQGFFRRYFQELRVPIPANARQGCRNKRDSTTPLPIFMPGGTLLAKTHRKDQMSRNIGFGSTRFAGTDGVTLEAGKWAYLLKQAGQHRFWFAGELDRDPEHSFTKGSATLFWRRCISKNRC